MVRHTLLRFLPAAVLALPVALFISCGGGGGGGTGNGGSNLGPAVGRTSPADNALNVAPDASVSADFDRAVDPATVNQTSFQVRTFSGRTVPGTVTINGSTATFAPSDNLALHATHVATIKAGIRDIAGNETESDYPWTFTTRDGTWGTAKPIAPTHTVGGGDYKQSGVAADPAGNVFAVWSGIDNNGTSGIWTSRFAAGIGWETPRSIGLDNRSGTILHVATDGSGNAMTVWTHADNAVWANRYIAGSGWESPACIRSVPAPEGGGWSSAWSAMIALSSGGRAAATWVEYQWNSGGSLQASSLCASIYDPGSGWGMTTILDIFGSDPVSVAYAALDAAGNIIVAWRRPGTGGYYDVVARRYTGSGWQGSELIDSSSLNWAEPAIAVDLQGNFTLAWARVDNPQQASVRAVRYVPGSGWGSPQIVSTITSGYVNGIQIAAGAGGEVVAGWDRQERSFDGISPITTETTWASYFDSGGGWETPVRLDTADQTSSGPIPPPVPSLAVDPNGNAIAAWRQWNGTRFDVYAARYLADSGWGISQPVEVADSPTGGPPKVAVDPNGRATVVWPQADEGSQGPHRLRSNRFQ